MMEKNGETELLLEDVTALEVIDDGLKVSTLFEGTKDLHGVALRRIDFTGGKVFLYKTA